MRHLRSFAVLALLLPLVFFGTPAWAVDSDRDVAVAERGVSAEELAAQLKTAAEEQRLVEGKRVIYEEVLQDPDNIELNTRYARQQIADNDLLGASGTLERILMINPELAAVRFLYAVVLYRLDNLKEAERELGLLLKEKELPGTLRGEVEQQLKKIRLRRRATHYTIRQTVGYGIDGNRNAAPNSKTNLVNDLPTALSGTDLRRRDTNFMTVQRASVTHDLGFQAGHEVFGEFTYFLQEQTQADNLDLQSFGGKVGGTFKNESVNLTPTLFLSHLFLSRESFLRTQGFNLAADRALGDRWSVSAATNVERQNYMNIADNTTGAQRKGPEVKQDLSVSYLLTSTMKLSSGIGYTYKQAEEQHYAYTGLNLNGSFLWLLGKGQYLVQSIETDFDFYDEPDFSRTSEHRKDKSLRLRTTYGVPLSLFQIKKILPKYLDEVLGDMILGATYEFYRAMSNITNYTYNNHKFQGTLSKTWSF